MYPIIISGCIGLCIALFAIACYVQIEGKENLLCWLSNLLLELPCHVSKDTLVYCDKVSAVYLSSNPFQHQHTEHIEMDIHFVLEKVTCCQVACFFSI